jgi:tight adherence protein B
MAAWGAAASAVAFAATFLLFLHGHAPVRAFIAAREEDFDRVLRRELLTDFSPRSALWTCFIVTVLAALTAYATLGLLAAAITAGVFAFVPGFVLRHLALKRLRRLDLQLPDGLTSLSSGVRAGLNLVQAMQLLVRDSRGPIQQEFAQMLREYEMGLDLNQAMRNAANRIGSPLYRLTFTAIEMHRIRGGDSGESMDRIAESVREIQRLEGKLDAVTSQSRMQAAMLTFMPVAILCILFVIAPEQTKFLFTSTLGKLTMVGAAGAILFARWWIHKIMQVDI